MIVKHFGCTTIHKKRYINASFIHSFINHQGGLISKCLYKLVNYLLVWAQTNLRSLRATHVPGKINQEANMLSRNNVPSEEWTLHPLSVQKIWEVFGRARVWQSRFLPLRRQFLLPNLFHKDHGCPSSQVAQSSALCTPSNALIASVL